MNIVSKPAEAKAGGTCPSIRDPLTSIAAPKATAAPKPAATNAAAQPKYKTKEMSEEEKSRVKAYEEAARKREEEAQAATELERKQRERRAQVRGVTLSLHCWMFTDDSFMITKSLSLGRNGAQESLLQLVLLRHRD